MKLGKMCWKFEEKVRNSYPRRSDAIAGVNSQSAWAKGGRKVQPPTYKISKSQGVIYRMRTIIKNTVSYI